MENYNFLSNEGLQDEINDKKKEIKQYEFEINNIGKSWTKSHINNHVKIHKQWIIEATFELMLMEKALKRRSMTDRERIQDFIDENRYAYKVEDILNEYVEKYGKGYYKSHTMKHCIDNLKNEIENILKEN